jgi:outer membrane protein OmpA-like peptidoglycan-associated protein
LAIATLALFAGGCATKKYVRHRIDERVAPVEARTGELEETSRRHTTEIERLSTEVTDARSRADKAQVSADKAQVSANRASEQAKAVNARVDTVIENYDTYKLDRTITVTFRVNRSTLEPEAMAALDALAAELAGKKGYVIEIQGYTDSTGTDMRNRVLSDARARAVYQYLGEKDIPLFRMSLLGFGEGRPIADNTTRDGRRQNRRVEVRVLVTSL